MRAKILMILVLAVSTAAFGGEPQAYQTGKLLQMDLVPCDPGAKLLCQEYVLQTDQVVYHLRPHERHPAMMPTGSYTQFRLAKDMMMVRPEGVEVKEHPYVVVSVAPRTESDAADARPVRLNHLQ